MKQDIFYSFLCISKKSPAYFFGLNVLSACCKRRKPWGSVENRQEKPEFSKVGKEQAACSNNGN